MKDPTAKLIAAVFVLWILVVVGLLMAAAVVASWAIFRYALGA